MRTRNLFLLLFLALLTAALTHGQGLSSSQGELPKFQPPASTFALPPTPKPRPKPAPPGMVEGRSTAVHWELEFHGGGFLAPQLTDTPRPLLLGLAPFNGPEGTYFVGNGAAHANSVLSGFSLGTTPFDNALIRDQVNRQQGTAAASACRMTSTSAGGWSGPSTTTTAAWR
ncbi:MAG TPA: hypothetical protein VL382_07335 [Terriglobales bacterium]|nr:hypothetical protein [Terriglobales bacterium]